MHWMIWLLVPSPLPLSRVLTNHMVYCGQTANGRMESHWFLGREANLCPGTSRPYVLWLVRMWQQRQGRPAQPRNVRLNSKSPNILVWRINVSSSQLRWSRLVHSMRQLVRFEGSREKNLRPVRWRERVPSCSKGYLLSFNVSTLSCSTTVLRQHTTWANGHSSVYIF